MAQTSFGNRRAWGLCNLRHEDRLAMVSKGLPLILESAESFYASADLLEAQGRHREATVLHGFAIEEAAKVLILMDLVRCPKRRTGVLCKPIVRTFYNHLARMIYSDAQAWRPTNVAALQTYVDHARKSHGLEGYVGEYIVPNWSLYFRESAMYADIEGHEDGTLSWNDPSMLAKTSFRFPPPALGLARAMRAVGLFEPKAVAIVSEVWSAVEFVDVQGAQDADRLTRTTLERMISSGLVPDAATDEDAKPLLRGWQLPMYNLDFKEIDVPLEDLAAEREAALWAEAGYSCSDY